VCECERHVTGEKCDRCEPGYWNMRSHGCQRTSPLLVCLSNHVHKQSLFVRGGAAPEIFIWGYSPGAPSGVQGEAPIGCLGFPRS